MSSNSSTVTVPASGATSSLSLVKSTTATSFGAAGQSIAYTYVVTNTGTRTVNGIGVSDNLVAGGQLPRGQPGPGSL